MSAHDSLKTAAPDRRAFQGRTAGTSKCGQAVHSRAEPLERVSVSLATQGLRVLFCQRLRVLSSSLRPRFIPELADEPSGCLTEDVRRPRQEA